MVKNMMVNFKMIIGITGLIGSGKDTVAKLLVEHKADLNARNSDQDTPLLLSITNNLIGLSIVLIKSLAISPP